MTRHQIMIALLRDGERMLCWRRSKRAVLVRVMDEASSEEWARAVMEFLDDVVTPGKLPSCRNELLELLWERSTDLQRKDAIGAFLRATPYRLAACAVIKANSPEEEPA